MTDLQRRVGANGLLYYTPSILGGTVRLWTTGDYWFVWEYTSGGLTLELGPFIVTSSSYEDLVNRVVTMLEALGVVIAPNGDPTMYFLMDKPEAVDPWLEPRIEPQDDYQLRITLWGASLKIYAL